MTSVPEIRFKGFTDAWEQRKLGEVISEKISNGIMNRPGKNELNVRHINVVNLYAASHIHVCDLEFFNATQKDIEKCNVEIGDIFLTRSSLKVEGIAQANILLDDGVFVFDDHIMRLKLTTEFEPFFVKEALNHSPTKKEFMSKSKTGTMTTIGQDDISSSDITFPKKNEQSSIGTFFRTLDNAIARYKRRLDGLKQLKSAYLQQLFPQTGERVPNVRFAGFNGEWLERTLGEVCKKITTGKLDANAMVADGAYDFYTSGVKKYRIDEFAFEGPAITIAGNGATVGYMHLANENFNAYQRTYVLTNFNVDRQFLFSEIGNKLPKKIAEEVRAGNIPYIVMDMLTGLRIKVPSEPDEQIAIGSFFRTLDEQITAQQSRIEQVTQLKAAYLQKMFV
jgi:type I restriction enzyme S subunit